MKNMFIHKHTFMLASNTFHHLSLSVTHCLYPFQFHYWTKRLCSFFQGVFFIFYFAHINRFYSLHFVIAFWFLNEMTLCADFHFRFDALLVLTLREHKKCSSYLKLCEREREFGSAVPFKCKLLNVPEKNLYIYVSIISVHITYIVDKY